MPQVIVQVDASIFDYKSEEVEELVHILQDLGSEYEVQAVYREIGGGLEYPFFETIAIWLSEDIPWDSIASGAAGGVAGAVGNRVIDWMRQRFYRRPADQRVSPEGTIPIRREIYGPRGELLDIVELGTPDAQPTKPKKEVYPEVRRSPSNAKWPPPRQTSKED